MTKLKDDTAALDQCAKRLQFQARSVNDEMDGGDKSYLRRVVPIFTACSVFTTPPPRLERATKADALTITYLSSTIFSKLRSRFHDAVLVFFCLIVTILCMSNSLLSLLLNRVLSLNPCSFIWYKAKMILRLLI